MSAPWCRTCGSHAETDGRCMCWAALADALQRYLGLDFDGSADVAARMWAASSDDDKRAVWENVYADEHPDVTVFPDPDLPVPAVPLPEIDEHPEFIADWGAYGERHGMRVVAVNGEPELGRRIAPEAELDGPKPAAAPAQTYCTGCDSGDHDPADCGYNPANPNYRPVDEDVPATLELRAALRRAADAVPPTPPGRHRRPE